jgi:hypothetical protein
MGQKILKGGVADIAFVRMASQKFALLIPYPSTHPQNCFKT